MTLSVPENTAPWVFYELMQSLDQAFMMRQGLAAQGVGQWGEQLFSALNEQYPAWADKSTEIYVAANHLLNHFARTQTGALTAGSIIRNPESFLRLVLLVLQNDLVPVRG